MINWIIFVWLLMLFTMVLLVKDRQRLLEKIRIQENNLAEIDKQIDSGRIILDLKK